MCGILAIQLNKESDNLFDDKILESIKKRGPDQTVSGVDKDFILSFCRLAINDITIDGQQPFILDDITLMCNGEIYNSLQLQNIFNLDVKSKSDTECLIYLYRKLGIDFINHVRGEYAIVIRHENRLLLFRDPVGIRPLFYGMSSVGSIIVSSTADCILKCGGTNITQVPPGTSSYNMYSNEFSFIRDYKFPPDLPITDITSKTLRNILRTSVLDRLNSDRPIGFLLSGGLDSSLIVSIACKIMKPSKIRTYSVGIKGSKDLLNARRVAEWLGTTHSEIEFTVDEGFDAIPEVIRDLESYDITTVRASVGMWLAAKYISEKTDDIVLLSGEGADELFCGYLYFHYAPSPEQLENESRRLQKNLHMYDVLRADRCIASHGLELRVPFLDERVQHFARSLPPELKSPKNRIEKYFLRESFNDCEFLPDDILWRRKDGMSDGVSGDSGKRWYENIQEKVEPLVSDDEAKDFPSKEAYYYKKIFTQYFPGYDPKIDYWLPKWVEHNGDPSGRNLEIFEKEN